jgi:F0F1-type ATP synthase membrane subunit a
MSSSLKNEILYWNVDDYLLENFGAKQIPMAVLAPITFIYVLLFVSGVVNNVAICGIIICNRTMRTSGTNYYLFSLAMANLIFLLVGICC